MNSVSIYFDYHCHSLLHIHTSSLDFKLSNLSPRRPFASPFGLVNVTTEFNFQYLFLMWSGMVWSGSVISSRLSGQTKSAGKKQISFWENFKSFTTATHFVCLLFSIQTKTILFGKMQIQWEKIRKTHKCLRCNDVGVMECDCRFRISSAAYLDRKKEAKRKTRRKIKDKDNPF